MSRNHSRGPKNILMIVSPLVSTGLVRGCTNRFCSKRDTFIKDLCLGLSPLLLLILQYFRLTVDSVPTRLGFTLIRRAPASPTTFAQQKGELTSNTVYPLLHWLA